jgi:hypothetical protein
MFIRALAISALAIGLATTAMAQNSRHGTHTTEMFKGPRVQSVIGSGTNHSKDAILPDGTINVDPTVTGSVGPNSTTSFSQPRLQCDSSPNTSEMRSNTFDAAQPSNCP